MTNDKPQMRSDRGIEMTEPPFEIRERTFVFAVRVVKLVKRFPRTLDAIEIGRQLLRAATSVGANVEEAHGAESQRDFVHKMGIACKEVRETRYLPFDI
jgi:four helix bundle protein